MNKKKLCHISDIENNRYLVQYQDGTFDIMCKNTIRGMGGDFVFGSKGEFKNMEEAMEYLDGLDLDSFDMFEIEERNVESTRDLVG